VQAEVETSLGSIFIQIPMFEVNVQKLAARRISRRTQPATMKEGRILVLKHAHPLFCLFGPWFLIAIQWTATSTQRRYARANAGTPAPMEQQCGGYWSPDPDCSRLLELLGLKSQTSSAAISSPARASTVSPSFCTLT
jgi:hypothetical protein